MAENQVLVASAVIVPDIAEQLVPPPLTSKRRQSLGSEGGSKRLRLSQEHSSKPEELMSLPLTTLTPSFAKEANVKVEERRRGKRLFGALLGTLAQSSSSTAQKRRVDIEKKQQAKLKLQDEEYDEKKKQRLDALIEVRRWEQKKYNKQSMQIQHSNLLATANFLQTKSEPKLYYKPWNPLPEDQTKIRTQIDDAEALIDRESAAYEAEKSLSVRDGPSQESQTSLSHDHIEDPKKVGQVTNRKVHVDEFEVSDANVQAVSKTENGDDLSNAHNILVQEDHMDNGGDIIVEGEEDTVIY